MTNLCWSWSGLASPNCLPISHQGLKNQLVSEASRLRKEGILVVRRQKKKTIWTNKKKKWFPISVLKRTHVAKPEEINLAINEQEDLSIKTLGTRGMHVLLRNFSRYRIDFSFKFNENNVLKNETQSIFVPTTMEWSLLRKILIDVLNLNEKSETLEACFENNQIKLHEETCVKPGSALILFRKPKVDHKQTKDKPTIIGKAYEQFMTMEDHTQWTNVLNMSETLARSEARYEKDINN